MSLRKRSVVPATEATDIPMESHVRDWKRSCIFPQFLIAMRSFPSPVTQDCKGLREVKQNNRNDTCQNHWQAQPQLKQLTCCCLSPVRHHPLRSQLPLCLWVQIQGVPPKYEGFVLAKTSRLEGTETQPKVNKVFFLKKKKVACVCWRGGVYCSSHCCAGVWTMSWANHTPPPTFPWLYHLPLFCFSASTIVPQTGLLNAEENMSTSAGTQETHDYDFWY